MIRKDNLKRKSREVLRFSLNKSNRNNLKNKDFTLICSNCIGGVISHELGLEFLSPTINMYFKASDFIKFCGNIEHYINSELELLKDNSIHYPVVKCDDITLYCVHFHSFEDVKEKWVSRGKRINWDNLFLIMSERDGCTKQDIITFDRLPYKNKVIFVHEPMPEIKCSCYIPGTELDGKDNQWVEPLTSYMGMFTGRRYIDLFDYVNFFNTGEIRLINEK